MNGSVAAIEFLLIGIMVVVVMEQRGKRVYVTARMFTVSALIAKAIMCMITLY